MRAMAFHAGVLRFLAERGRMESVSRVSSVSGGSLLTGIVFSRSDMKWPASTRYLEEIHPEIRRLLVTQNLQTAALTRLILRPCNWRFLFERTKVVAQTIREIWNIEQTLGDFRGDTLWTLNGTTAETGKRFQFKHDDFGDYQTGYAQAPRFPLASAMAASAAFPGGIGPLPIDARKYRWMQRPSWDATAGAARPAALPFAKLHIYDGGVYDNLGMEPLFDMGRRQLRGPFRLIAADAGMPVTKGFKYGPLNPFRMERLMNIMLDQTRALRVRSFIDFLQHGGAGAYLGIDALPLRLLAARGIAPDPAIAWLPDDAIARAQHYPTTLTSMSADAFDLIESHGYQTALANQMAYPYLA